MHWHIDFSFRFWILFYWGIPGSPEPYGRCRMQLCPLCNTIRRTLLHICNNVYAIMSAGRFCGKVSVWRHHFFIRYEIIVFNLPEWDIPFVKMSEKVVAPYGKLVWHMQSCPLDTFAYAVVSAPCKTVLAVNLKPLVDGTRSPFITSLV